MKKKRIILVGVAIVLLVAGGLYQFAQNRKTVLLKQAERSGCLGKDEVASYEIKQQETTGGEGVAIISIKDKKSQKEKFNFQIDILQVQHYHPIELHKCGVYAVRSFNYNFIIQKTLAGYRAELWKYDYAGNKKKLVLLDIDSVGGMRGYKNFFSSDFRVSPDEKYIFLIKSYLGKDDYALVIKDLDTKEDIYELKLKDVLEKHPDVMPGSIGLGIFTPDGKYFWGDIYDGARETAYYRIEMGTWKTDILPLPKDIPAGVERAWSFGGWVAYANIPSFSGFAGTVEQLEKEAREKGEKKTLTMYNLFTKEKKTISRADPSHRFKPSWISDTELEYTLPDGKKKIYDTGEGEGK